MDIVKILSVLPHRFPFLLVDRVVEVVQGEPALARSWPFLTWWVPLVGRL